MLNEPLYSGWIAPLIKILSLVVSPCAATVVTVAVVEERVIEAIFFSVPPYKTPVRDLTTLSAIKTLFDEPAAVCPTAMQSSSEPSTKLPTITPFVTQPKLIPSA